MKYVRPLLYIFIFFSLLAFGQETYSVTAKSGLTLRSTPNSNGNKIGSLPYGTMVEIVEITDNSLTITDEGKEINGQWVKVTFDNNTEISIKESSGYVFDGYLKKIILGRGNDVSIDSSQELLLYELSSSEKTPKGRIGFISLTDTYGFDDDVNSSVIAKEHLGEQVFEDDNYHTLSNEYRSSFLKSLNIQENDSIFIYHFISNRIYKGVVSQTPVVARINNYGAQMPVQQYDYMVGFEIGDPILQIEDITNYYSSTLAYIGQENPFVKGELRPIIWEKVEASHFPTIKEIPNDSIALYDTYEFTTGNLIYLIQDVIVDGHINKRSFKVIGVDVENQFFEKVFRTSEGAEFKPLNTVHQKQNNQIMMWTGNLFKNRPPIITDFLYFSFGCPGIYFLDQAEKPAYIKCDNRH